GRSQLVRLGIPDSDRPVQARRGDQATVVRRKGDVLDDLLVPGQGMQGTRGEVPHTDRIILVTGDDPTAVGAEREAMRLTPQEGERLALRPGLRTPELEHAVVDGSEMTADGHPLAIRAQRDSRVVARATRQLEYTAHRAVPDEDAPTLIDRD